MRSENLKIKEIQNLTKNQIVKYSNSLKDYETKITLNLLKEKEFSPIPSDQDSYFCYKVQCDICGKIYQDNQKQKILKHHLYHLSLRGKLCQE